MEEYQPTYNQLKDKILQLEHELKSLKDAEKKSAPNIDFLQSEGKYKHIFLNSCDPAFILKNNTFSECNKAALNILKISNPLIIKDIEPYKISPERQYCGTSSVEKAKKMIQIANQKGFHQFEWQHIDFENQLFDVEVSLTSLPALGENILLTTWREISKRKKAEQALIENENKLKRFVENSPTGFFQMSLKQGFYKINSAFANILGYETSQTLLTKFAHLKELFWENSEWHKFLTILEKKTVINNFETEFRNKNGEKISISIEAVLWKSGQETYFDGTITDITEKVKSNLRLKLANEAYEIVNDKLRQLNNELLKAKLIAEDKQARYSALVNNLLAGVFYINIDGSIEEINPAMVRMLGSPSAEATKKINLFNFKPLIKIGYVDNLKKCIEEKRTIFGENEYTSIYGKKAIVNYYFEPIKEAGKIIGVLACNENITEKKHAEEKLLFQSILLSNISDFITATDLQGKIIYTNKKVQEAFQKTEDELLGMSVNFYGEDTEQGSSQQGIIDQTNKYGSWRGEIVNINKNKERIYLDCRTQILTDANGNPYAMIGISTDISERKHYENELKKKNNVLAQRNSELQIAKQKAEESGRLKTAFLANISHEVRTPMNGILGFADLLKRNDTSDSERVMYSNIIIESCLQLLRVVSDIMDVSKIDAGQVKIDYSKTNITRAVSEIYNAQLLNANKKNIEFNFETETDETEIIIFTDEKKLRQILDNLIDNAIKFTPSGGKIELKYKHTSDNINFIIRDNGIGIPASMHSAIFERFRQVETDFNRQSGGTGLGLSISSSYVELLGGKIWLESESGEGATFYFTIPCKTTKNVAIEKEILEKKVNPNIKTNEPIILVVEDEEYNFLFIQEVFRTKKVKLLHAKNGLEAIEFCKEMPEISLILMDFKMPIMDGQTATPLIKKIMPHVPIIAQTAHSMVSDRNVALSIGCDDYISKPIRPNDLIAIVEKFIDVNN